jgi:CheY-like chemotaxis protein
MNLSEELKEIKRQLLDTASDENWVEGEDVWTDEDEIGQLVRDAFARGMETEVVIACAQACRSAAGFKHHLSGLIGARKQRILLIDDEESFLEMLKMNIEMTKKYEVQIESDPTKALDHLESFQPDLCVIDVIMPDMDGFDLLRKIHDESHLKTVPVIILTALLRDTGIDATTRENTLILSKPIKTQKLLYCIDEHLRSGGTRAAR